MSGGMNAGWRTPTVGSIGSPAGMKNPSDHGIQPEKIPEVKEMIQEVKESPVIHVRAPDVHVTMDMTKIIEMFETISSRMDRIEKQYDRIERKIDEEFSKPKYEMYNEVEKRRLELRMETYAKTLNERMDQITLWGLIKKWLG
jgi:hypothetical protein